MAPYHIAVMNDDIAKFENDSMQQITKKVKIYEKYLTKNLKIKFLTCNVFVFYKNLLCRLQSLCLQHDAKAIGF